MLGSAPNSLRHPQNILVRVLSSTWHSSPITVSHSAIAVSLADAPDRTGVSTPLRILGRCRRRASRTQAPTWLIWVALGTVYVIWSTTYLGIRIANETCRR